MGHLTTHVLDTATGRPAEGVLVQLFKVSDLNHAISHAKTNADGRCDQPMLAGTEFVTGEYQLVFHAGDYFDKSDHSRVDKAAHPRFLNQIVIRFGICDSEQHYHVPLLLSPFGYSTYRGS